MNNDAIFETIQPENNKRITRTSSIAMPYPDDKLVIQSLPDVSVPVAEALNTLWTNISYSGYDMKTVAFTSCQPNEGKTYVAMNLARMISNTGKSVLLIDADLRKSVLVGRHKIKNIGGGIWGLVDYLSNQCSYWDTIYDTNFPNLSLVLAGHEVIDSFSLLDSPQFEIMLREIRDKFDVILIDTPPIGAIVDAALISRYCDGTIFVVKENVATKRELISGRQQIEKTGGRVLGAVMNDVSFSSYGMKKYQQKSYYNYYR